MTLAIKKITDREKNMSKQYLYVNISDFVKAPPEKDRSLVLILFFFFLV